MNKTFLIIDGNSVMHRAYHAIPLLSKDGVYTNAVYGFMTMVLKAIDEVKPEYLAVAFDKKGKVFRHDVFKEYKAGRKAMDEEMIPQFPLVKDVLKDMNITILEVTGFEADDVLGTLSKIYDNVDTKVLTGDKDALQLIDDNTQVLLMRKGISDIEQFDQKHFIDVYGVNPDQFVDVKALMGDKSDNIPGVMGVGEVTALKLISQYGSIEKVYENIDDQKGKLKEKLEKDIENAKMSKVLAKIICDVELDTDLSKMTFNTDDIKGGFDILNKLGMNSIVARAKGEKYVKPAFVKTVQRNIEDDVQEKIKKFAQPDITEIKDEEGLARVLQNIGKQDLAVYFGDDFYLAFGDTQIRISLQNDLFQTGLDIGVALKLLKPYFKSNNIFCEDSKKLLRTLKSFGIVDVNITFDLGLCSYLIASEEKNYDIKTMMEKYFEAGDVSAFCLFPLEKLLIEKLNEQNLMGIYKDMELPLSKVLFDMEETGFLLDREALTKLNLEYGEKLISLEKQIFSFAGSEFNVASPKQLAVVLFETLNLPATKKTKTGYSTDADVLEGLRDKHEIIDCILEYRKIAKLKSTYVEGLLGQMDKDNRVHTRFWQTVTTTGRISSTEPNLQNIPIRTENGREIRKAFIAKPGCMLVMADYSQIELRVLAHLSKDKVLIDAFSKNQDIHARTASEVFGVDINDVDYSQRRAAKAVNFGIVYGISPFGLSTNLRIPVSVAKEYINSYLQKYSGVATYMNGIIEKAKIDGYVETIYGRRRTIPQINAKNKNIAAFGERIALNTPIQGTAADMIKVAMIRVYQKLAGLKSKLILQVHDELLIETPFDEVDKVKSILKECMENVIELSVPFIVDINVGECFDK